MRHRVLFQVRNRRGLGHMMRALNIARALRVLDPAMEILFSVRTRPPEGIATDGVRYVVERDHDVLSQWRDVLRDFRPDVVVYDTMLPKDAAAEPVIDSARHVYVMRRCLPERQREIFEHPFLARMDAVIVPHERAEFGYAVPEIIRDRTTYVGPIVREPDTGAQAALKAAYGIGDGDVLLTSTVGGGGYEAQADAFFATVFDAHRRLCDVLARVTHVVVQGPHYRKTLEPLDRMTVVGFEPQMIDRLAISDLVVAEGGYNTVNEIRITGTPAIFLPSGRGHDDQEGRVRALERAGLGFVFMPLQSAAVADKIRELLGAPSLLRAIRERYASHRAPLGNQQAATIILELTR